MMDEKKPTPPSPEEPENQPTEEEREGFWDRMVSKRIDALLPDVLKKTVVGTLGSLMMSEDGLRQTLADLKLPKEIINFILQQADNTRKEFMRVVARELRGFLETTNFYDEVRRILTSLSFEIKTEIRLIPNEQAFVKPKISNKIRVKKANDSKDDAEEANDTPQELNE